MPVPGPARRAINDALLESFDRDSLEQLLYFRLEDRLDRVSGGGAMPKVVFDIVSKSEQEGWTAKLAVAALAERPDNAGLASAAELLGLAAAAPAGRQLQRMISEAAGLLDPTSWRGRLAQIETQVCRIEIPVLGGSIRGTGFLVGADEVMTNQHVVERLIDGSAKPGGVRLRFDYKRLDDGIEVQPGTEVALAPEEEWLIASAPPSEVDDLTDPGDRVPDPGELDFALLRLDTSIGEEPVGINPSPSAPKRGWIPLERGNAPVVGAPLFILQHPAGEPLKLAGDSVLGVNANGTRVRYRVNTEKGSSGAPCFDINLKLVALHHSGDPDFDPAHKPEYNEGIPVTALVDHLEPRVGG